MKPSSNFVQPDITLNLDLSGVIRRAVLSNAIANESITGLVGRRWADTITPGDANVQRIIDDARLSGVSPFHQVLQRLPSGLELAVEYTAVRLGGAAGLIAIGRSLEAVADVRARLALAKSAMERESWKLRTVETRYRLLFNAASRPVLLLGTDETDTRIIEANPAAIHALGLATDDDLLPAIFAEQHHAFRGMLRCVHEHGKAPGIVLQLGAARQPWMVRASLVAHERGTVFMVQLSSTSVAPSVIDNPAKVELSKSAMREIIKGTVASIEDQCEAVARALAKRKSSS